jgi:hypothetical protein
MQNEQAIMTFIAILMCIVLGLGILVLASIWKLYEKAGQNGWAAIVPIYSTIVKLDIIEKPRWWIFLMIIPYVSLIWYVWATNLFVKKFGKDEAWTVGCIFLPFVFYPMMAFDDKVQFIGNDNHDNFMDERNNDLLDQI